MEDCIFCKIIRKEVPSFIVHEDDECLSFLDVMPRSKGMCIVVPKKHYNSFDDDFDMSSKVFSAALIVGEKIKKSLEPLTIFFSSFYSQIPHFHVRVYPVYKDQIPIIENKPIEIEDFELADLMKKISSIDVDWKPQEKIVEVVREIIVEKKKSEAEEKKVDERDALWKKRSMEIA